MTLQDLKMLNKDIITPAIAAKVLGCDPHYIRVAAHQFSGNCYGDKDTNTEVGIYQVFGGYTMKARVPLKSKLTKKVQNDMIALADEAFTKQQFGYTRRIYKAFCYSLNRDFGFGKQRLSFLLKSVNDIINEVDTDDCFWEHLDKVVIDEMKLEFEREEVNEDGVVIN